MKIRRVLKILFVGLLVLLGAAVGLGALNNLLTPTRSNVTDHLSAQEKARAAEIIHLRQSLGDALWQGFGQAAIPLIVYNEEYAFLIGYPEPPPGWTKVPQRSAHGGEWEPVPDDRFEGQTYYRMRLPSPDETPQNFTVLVGDRWVASLETKEWLQIAMGNFFGEMAPAPLAPLVPRGLIAGLFVGSSDKYITLGVHESFHAYQGMVAPVRLMGAETFVSREKEYPFNDSRVREMWQAELNLLAQAVRAETQEETRRIAQEFLAQRGARRAATVRDPGLVEYEREREWLEGLAKYVELETWRLAATSPEYEPSPALAADSDFKNYQTFQDAWAQEANQITLALGSEETVFYYSGMAQAVLLDRLMPEWKTRILEDGVTLDGLLGEAVGRTP